MARFHSFLPVIIALCVVAGAPVRALADDSIPAPGTAAVWQVYLENDIFGGSDRHYTNAVELSYQTPDLHSFEHPEAPIPRFLARFADTLPGADVPGVLHNVSLTLGQHIYTPSYTEAESVVEDDRPYAGWLYLATGLHTKTAHQLDTLEISLGLVGPSALGMQAQNNVHVLIGADLSYGWHNQLEDEPAINFAFQRSWRYFSGDTTGCETGENSKTPSAVADADPWGWDVVPHAGVVMGNVFSYVNAGAQVRTGYNVPGGFGTTPIRPGGGIDAPAVENDPRLTGDFGAYVFLGADARAVGRNIFLDGSTFADSHSVTKEQLVADFFGGIGLLYQGVRVTYTHVVRTREYKGQPSPQSFGSVNLSWTF